MVEWIHLVNGPIYARLSLLDRSLVVLSELCSLLYLLEQSLCRWPFSLVWLWLGWLSLTSLDDWSTIFSEETFQPLVCLLTKVGDLRSGVGSDPHHRQEEQVVLVFSWGILLGNGPIVKRHPTLSHVVQLPFAYRWSPCHIRCFRNTFRPISRQGRGLHEKRSGVWPVRQRSGSEVSQGRMSAWLGGPPDEQVRQCHYIGVFAQ